MKAALGRRDFLAGSLAVSLSPRLLAAAGDSSVGWDGADGTTMAHWVATGRATPGELLTEAVTRLRRVNPQ